MKNILAIIAYKCLVKYCESHGEYCDKCIFDDDRPKCMCIANIPTDWYKPNAKKMCNKGEVMN